jgi:oligopeptidase A
LARHLFGIEFIARKELDTWDKSVRPFEVHENGMTIGYLFLDLFARDEKTTDIGVAFPANRQLPVAGLRALELPIAVLSCSLSPALSGQPLLLKPERSRTLFREFGRCLQQLLNRDEHSGLLGINYAWESGEFFAALMEQWCCSRDFLVQIARHHQTGEPLSHRQADSLMILLTRQKGLQEARTLMLASLAVELHQEISEPKRTSEQAYLDAVDPGHAIRECVARVSEQVLVLPEPEIDNLAFSFNELVTGAGAACFVSPWSQALAQTVFARFEDRGLFNHEEGKRLRELVFAPSASRSILASVEAFLGRTLDELTAPLPT